MNTFCMTAELLNTHSQSLEYLIYLLFQYFYENMIFKSHHTPTAMFSIQVWKLHSEHTTYTLIDSFKILMLAEKSKRFT